MVIVGLPAMRRGSLDLVMRPCTVAPMGITGFPSSITASVTRAEKGSPLLLEKVARVFSSFTFMDVPAGSEILFCATADAASNITTLSNASFFISPPESVANFCKLLWGGQLTSRQFSDRLHNLLQWRTIRLVLAAIDITHRSAAIDDQRCGSRDIDCVHRQPVKQPVRLGHRAIFIQQKRK